MIISIYIIITLKLHREWQAASIAPLWVDTIDEVKENMGKIEENSIIII